MAIEVDPRTGLRKYTAGTDPHPTRVDFNARMDLLSAIIAMAAQGTSAERPTAGTSRRFYWDTEAVRLYFDDGTAWREVTTNGGGGAGAPIVVAGAAAEGQSDRSARADHTHSIGLATALVSGAMAAADKAKLDNATSSSTASTLARRDAFGRFQAAAPSAGSDVANRTYVSAQIETRAAAGHTHPATDIVSGILNPLRLPVVTVSEQGAMLAADKQKLDNASSSNLSGTIIVRDGTGRAHISNPTFASHIANKDYVDTQIGTRAPSSHSHEELRAGPYTAHLSPNDGALVAPGIYSNTYGTEPNAYVTSFGTLGRATIAMARAGHTHPASDITGNIDSSQILSLNSDKLFGNVSKNLIQGSADAWNRGPGSTYNTVVMRPDGTFCEFPSAAKFKQDIEDHVIAPERIYSLPPTVEFAYRQDPEHRFFGVIADRWADALPELIGTEEDNESIHNFHYEKMGVALVSAVQDLNKRNLDQAKEIAALKTQLADEKKARLELDKRISALEAK